MPASFPSASTSVGHRNDDVPGRRWRMHDRGNRLRSAMSEIGTRQFVAQRRGTSRICLLSALSRTVGGLVGVGGGREGGGPGSNQA